jgi:hypothetical protein
MPIPGEQFEKGLDKTKYQMLEFLKKNPDKAYRVEEIAEGIGVSTKTQDFGKMLLMAVALVWGYGSTLDSMVKEGLIDKKTIDGESYYRIHKM